MHADTNERNDHLIQRIVVKVFGLFQMSMNITRKMHSHDMLHYKILLFLVDFISTAIFTLKLIIYMILDIKLPPGTRYYESLQKDKAYCLNCTIEKRCCKKMNNSLAEIAFWSFNKKEISKLK